MTGWERPSALFTLLRQGQERGIREGGLQRQWDITGTARGTGKQADQAGV